MGEGGGATAPVSSFATIVACRVAAAPLSAVVAPTSIARHCTKNEVASITADVILGNLNALAVTTSEEE